MAQLWGGRFTKELNSDAKTLSYSIHFDKRLYPYDLKVNLAYARALTQVGIISSDELKALELCIADLQKVDVESIDTTQDEDIHSYVERKVTEALGDVGKKIHTGKSRNDQVITDVRLYAKEEINALKNELRALLRALWILASQHVDTLFPGFTHFQIAQPIFLAHHFLAYFEQFKRDLARFEDALKRVDVCPLGSGALAGNSFGVDRLAIAKELGFSSVSQNSMDAVGDRDFTLELLSHASNCMVHLSRLSDELVLWSSGVVGFIEIGDDFTTGSSLMPQKKNPDVAELIRGKTGRVTGHLVGLTQTLKGTPLTYNRDFQEDKEPLFDSFDTLRLSVRSMSAMLPTIKIKPKAIKSALDKGYILATDLADYLVRKGIPFRQAHDITGKVVLEAVQNDCGLHELSLNQFKAIDSRIENDVFSVFDLEKAVNQKNSIGGTASNQIHRQLKQIQEDYKWQ